MFAPHLRYSEGVHLRCRISGARGEFTNTQYVNLYWYTDHLRTICDSRAVYTQLPYSSLQLKAQSWAQFSVISQLHDKAKFSRLRGGCSTVIGILNTQSSDSVSSPVVPHICASAASAAECCPVSCSTSVSSIALTTCQQTSTALCLTRRIR